MMYFLHKNSFLIRLFVSNINIMMNKFILSLVLISLFGCAQVKEKPTVQAATKTNEEIVEVEHYDIPPPVPVEQIFSQRPVYQSTETVLTDLIHTKLEVSFNWENQTMNGVATITAKPHFYASSSLILDAKSMIINSVKMNGESLKYEYDNAFLTINLGKEFNRKQEYTVVIDYIAQPEKIEAGHGTAITSDKGLYFINPTGENPDQMPQIWTQGETESSSVWFPTIDSPNAKTSQEIFIKVKSKYTTLSNGKLITSRKVGNDMRIDHWKQDLPHSTYLFMMAIGEFKVIKDEYKRADGTFMEVNYYVEPEWEKSAKAIFGETPEMIKFFSERLGVEYPWDKYHQIVVREYVSGAMENTGAVICGDYVYKNERELLDGNDQSTIAHELFHHWFGDLVTAESWSNLTLNESFANYSQYLWDEHRFGIDEADYNAIIERNGYYQSAQVQGYHDLVWFDYGEKYQMFDGHSYNKGGRILHMLRNYLGDDAFFTALTKYLKENQFKAAEFHQLRLAFEEVSGEDLNWFFNQWYLGSGHPSLNIKHTVGADNVLTISVEQTQDLEEFPIFKLPMNVAIYTDKGKFVIPIVVDKVNQVFQIPFEGKYKNVVFDDQAMLLAKVKDDKKTAEYIHQFYHAKKYETRLKGLEKGSRDKTEVGQQMILDAMNDPFWNIRMEGIKKSSKLKNEFKESGKEIIKGLIKNDENSKVRSAALKQAKRFLTDDELKTIYKDRIQNDPSYLVVSNALKSLGSIAPEEAMVVAKGLEKEKSSSLVAGIAQLYAGHGTAEQYTFFENEFKQNNAQGFDRLGVLNSFTLYITKQNPSLVLKSAEIYKNLGKSKGPYMQMFLPQNTTYVLKQIQSKMDKLNTQLAEQEKSNDVQYASETRKEIAQWEECKTAFEGI